MVSRFFRCHLAVAFCLLVVSSIQAQPAGSIRGMVYDKDFEAPLPNARITVAETGQTVEGTPEGNYLISGLEAGTYTLVFAKDGYTRQLKADVVVSPGQMTEVDVWLTGDFAEMEEFVVQDVQIGGGTETALLELRMESPALMDSISADLMSKAGAGDAASALRLVAGATVQDGKYAVIRGLPDRYVSSQMNSVRLPTADEDKRAVELDQFPSDAIESVQVSKTFMPDQQGDASGGAVNVVLKKIPEELTFSFSLGTGWDTQASGRHDFLHHDGKDMNYFGEKKDDIPYDKLGENWEGPFGSTREDSPIDYSWSLAAGGKYDFEDYFSVGAFGSFFYERNSSYYEDGIDDKYWVEQPGADMTPQYNQGSPGQGDFKTKLFDVTQGSKEIKWGFLGTVGAETENHGISLTYLYTHAAEDKVTLAEDTRGKAFYFPGYDVNDSEAEGNQKRDAAPYLRMQTMEFTERDTQTVQLAGEHKIPLPDLNLYGYFGILGPEFDWYVANSYAQMYQPDKTQFGSLWLAESYYPGFQPYVDPFTRPSLYMPYKPAANFTIGNVQRIWKKIYEESEQYAASAKLPFVQWTEAEGYVKFGVFHDEVVRDYWQESFSNFGDNASYEGDWDEYWSVDYHKQDHPFSAAKIDVDYQGEQMIDAWYYMVDVPLVSDLPFLHLLKVVGGTRYEKTELSIINFPEEEVTWIPEGALGPLDLLPGEADVDYQQEDILPALAFEYAPFEPVSLRGSYSETVARQTFKELSPIQQQEYLGGDVFIGNPNLTMSALKNYDLRLDYRPFESSLISASYFYKKVKDPIEYVQRIAGFAFTTPVNYPKGRLEGYEFELRQQIGQLLEALTGLTIGANATLIKSEVTLPPEESAQFEAQNIQAPMTTRDMTNAPEHLYNAFFTYDLTELGLTGTELGVFYTVRGDTLVAGAGQSNGSYVPNVYEKEYGTLNASISQKIGEHWKIKLSAKNLTDPKIETVYRSKYLEEDVTKTSYRKGMSFSISIGGKF